MKNKLLLPFALVPCMGLYSNQSIASYENEDLFSLDLTQLMNIRVDSATKRPQTLADTAAAIYVISKEEIRRSAATTIPDVLQLAPGVEVARINGSTWAVTVRGFQTQFANKLLVLIDGRSVYTPLYSGVYWDSHMPLLEDIDRIEVIRGPGSSLWGSNAVNGVINIITKQSIDTVGQLVSAGAGNVEEGFVRYRGGHEFEQGAFRYHAQYREVDDSIDHATGEDAGDDWRVGSVGFRTDWQTEHSDKFTLQGDYVKTDKNNNFYLEPYTMQQVPEARSNISAESANILGRWTHPYSQGNSHIMQAYVDWSDREESTYRYQRTTVDIDYQFNHQKSELQQFTWGFSYRWIDDEYQGSFALELLDPELEYHLATAFFQDEIYLSKDLTLIAGVKLEDSHYTDFDYQPSLRLLWNSNQNLTLWAAASRAIRTPSRAGKSMIIRGALPDSIQQVVKNGIFNQTGLPPAVGTVIGQLEGSEQFEAESMRAYELGLRNQVNSQLFVDATVFHHEYKHLRTFEIANPAVSVLDTDQATYYVASGNFVYGNEADASAHGFELAANWNPYGKWQMKLSYSYLNMVVEPYQGETATGASEFSDQSPLHQARFRSWHEFGDSWEFDWSVKYYDELPNDDISDYTDLDVRLSYLISNEFEVSLVGKNLIDTPRVEFEDTIQGPYRTEMRRSIYAQFTWRSQ